MAIQLFGFEIKRKSDEVDNKRVRSFVEPNEGDGSINVTATVPPGQVQQCLPLWIWKVMLNRKQN